MEVVALAVGEFELWLRRLLLSIRSNDLGIMTGLGGLNARLSCLNSCALLMGHFLEEEIHLATARPGFNELCNAGTLNGEAVLLPQDLRDACV